MLTISVKKLSIESGHGEKNLLEHPNECGERFVCEAGGGGAQ